MPMPTGEGYGLTLESGAYMKLISEVKKQGMMKLLIDKTKGYVYDFQRSPRRISLKIRFKVSGRDENGFPFENQAETVDISSGGGCLVFNKDVRKGENLILWGPNGSSFLVTVRWFKYDVYSDLRYVGFKLIEPARGWVVNYDLS